MAQSRKAARTNPERRNELMEAALALFAKHGFDKTTVSAITSAAGVSQGTFYWYFPTKDEVLVALMDRALSEGATAAAEIMSRPLSGREKILVAIEYLQQLLGRDRDLWTVVHARTLDSGSVQQAHERAHEAIVMPFLMLIRRGVDDGSIHLGGELEIIARLLVAMIDFAFTDSHTRDSPVVLLTVKRLVDLIFSGEAPAANSHRSRNA